MMAIYKSGWLRVPNDPENFKERFAWSHVKTVFYDKVKNILLKDKLDDMDGLIADHADAIANKLMTNDAFNTAIADYVTKAMMSSTQVNDANHVPTSSLAYAMQQAITANANAITQLNSEASTHLKESGSENSFCAAFQSRYQYNTNANYMLASGIYKTGKTGLNLPFESYWIIITFNTSNNLGNSSTAWITQFAISTDWSDKAIYFRRNINYTPTTWESWNRLVAS